MKTIELNTRAEWRAWLANNHEKEDKVWLVYYKVKSGKPSLSYDSSVEEALCFGWVDSLIKRLDENRYARKFTPRKEVSNWSALNKKRAAKMIREGLMTDHGLKKIKAAKRIGSWDRPGKKPELTFSMPKDFSEALHFNKEAKETFGKLSATQKKQYLGWIEIAKRVETREKRIKESIRLLSEGKMLGLK